MWNVYVLPDCWLAGCETCMCCLVVDWLDVKCVCCLAVESSLPATAATVSAGLGSVFTQIKGAFSPFLPSLYSLDWFSLAMAFLCMRPNWQSCSELLIVSRFLRGKQGPLRRCARYFKGEGMDVLGLEGLRSSAVHRVSVVESPRPVAHMEIVSV
jgi:hypothetical protein